MELVLQVVLVVLVALVVHYNLVLLVFRGVQLGLVLLDLLVILVVLERLEHLA